jgi:parvulin-like peptidyl-prolyl isomerase
MKSWFSCPQAAKAIMGLCVVASTLGAAMAAEGGTDIVARLGPTQYSAAALGDFVRSLDKNVRKRALADPQLMNRLVGLELARIALLGEAKAKQWERRPEVVRQIEKARDQAILATYLTSVAVLPKDYPSEAEIKSAYDLNRDGFMAPRQYRLEQIFVALPAGSDKKAIAAARNKIEDLARRAKAKNANFEDIARANSEHKPSAARGGDLGWADQNQIVPEIRDQVAGMSRGDISDPILSTTGWHIVRLVDTKAAAPRPLPEVRDALIATLRQRKMQEIQQAYIARMLEKNPVAVNEAGLRSLFEAAP